MKHRQKRDIYKGTRRELGLALRAVRTALTHARWADTLNPLPPPARVLLRLDRDSLYRVEESLCVRLAALK